MSSRSSSNDLDNSLLAGNDLNDVASVRRILRALKYFLGRFKDGVDVWELDPILVALNTTERRATFNVERAIIDNHPQFDLLLLATRRFVGVLSQSDAQIVEAAVEYDSLGTVQTFMFPRGSTAAYNEAVNRFEALRAADKARDSVAEQNSRNREPDEICINIGAHNRSPAHLNKPDPEKLEIGFWFEREEEEDGKVQKTQNWHTKRYPGKVDWSSQESIRALNNWRHQTFLKNVGEWKYEEETFTEIEVAFLCATIIRNFGHQKPVNLDIVAETFNNRFQDIVIRKGSRTVPRRYRFPKPDGQMSECLQLFKKHQTAIIRSYYRTGNDLFRQLKELTESQYIHLVKVINKVGTVGGYKQGVFLQRSGPTEVVNLVEEEEEVRTMENKPDNSLGRLQPVSAASPFIVSSYEQRGEDLGVERLVEIRDRALATGEAIERKLASYDREMEGI